MLFSTNYVLETRSDLSIISVPLQLIAIAVVPADSGRVHVPAASLQAITGKKESLQLRS